MNKKIASEIAIGILLLVAMVFGVVFYLQNQKVQAPQSMVIPQTQTASLPVISASQTQPAPQPVAAQQQASQQDQQQTQPQVPQTGKVGATYTNVEYGFQFTMPQSWLDIAGDYAVTTGKTSDGTVYIEFAAKSTDKNWISDNNSGLPKGYANLFEIGLIKKSDWDQDLKTCNDKKEICLHTQLIFGENNNYVFAFWPPQEGPSNFTMYSSDNMKNYSKFFAPIKAGFKLISVIDPASAIDIKTQH